MLPAPGRAWIEFANPHYYADALDLTELVFTVVATEQEEPTPDPTETPDPTTEPTPTQEPTTEPEPTSKPTEPTYPGDLYSVPGLHYVNGRYWNTTCEAYSQTYRCRTDIWGTQIVASDGVYKQVNGWVFNNLTYLPSPRAMWAGNRWATPVSGPPPMVGSGAPSVTRLPRGVVVAAAMR